MAFDKLKYDNEYKKKYKKQFKVELNIEENEELIKLLEKHNLTKVDFVRWAMEELKKKNTK